MAVVTPVECGEVEVVKQWPCTFAAKQKLLAARADVRWTLVKGEQLMSTSAAALCSPRFDVACAGDHTSSWHLVLDMSKGDDIGLFFGDRRLDSAGKLVDQWAHSKVSIGDYEKDTSQSHEDEPRDGWANFIHRRELFDKCFKDEQLVIMAWASITVFHSHAADYNYLAETVTVLFDEGLGDFIVRCHGRDIRVLRKLLALKSPVFAQMLAVDMQETRTGVLIIDDFAYNTIHSMIQFMYIGQLLDGMDTVELLAAANKYQIERLKQLCSDRLTGELTLANACQMLILGETQDAAELKKAALDTICADLSAATATEGWKTCFDCDPSKLNVSLLNEVLDAVEKKGKEGGD